MLNHLVFVSPQPHSSFCIVLPPWNLNASLIYSIIIQKRLARTRYPVCYGRGDPYLFFSIYLSGLYTLLSLFLQQLYCYSFPGLNQRSRHPDLDLQYDFSFWQTIPFPHTSPYSMVVFPPFHLQQAQVPSQFILLLFSHLGRHLLDQYINLPMYSPFPQLVLHFTCSVIQSLLLDSLCDLSLTSFLSQGRPPRRPLGTLHVFTLHLSVHCQRSDYSGCVTLSILWQTVQTTRLQKTQGKLQSSKIEEKDSRQAEHCYLCELRGMYCTSPLDTFLSE